MIGQTISHYRVLEKRGGGGMGVVYEAALAYILVIGTPERFRCGKQIGTYLGMVPTEDSKGWDTLVSKGIPYCVTCCPKQRRRQRASTHIGDAATCTWRCAGTGVSPRWPWDAGSGVHWTLAAVIIAELGVDMKVFGNVFQLASWAGVCPGNNEWAGKRKSSRIPKGNVYLKTALVEAAHAAARAKGTYLRDKFYRLKARRGYKRAVVAVAHKILVAIYHIFSHQVCYNELGDLYLDKLNKHHLKRNLVHRLERLGYTVTLTQKAA